MASELQALAAEYLLDDLHVSPVDKSIVGVSFARQLIVVGSLTQQVTYPFTAIIAVEVIRNRVSLTQTNRGSQLVAGTVGGAVFGGVGALAGALSGSTRSTDRVSNVAIRLTVEDPLSPTYVVELLATARGKGLDPLSGAAQMALDAANRAHGQVLIAMRKASSSAQPTPDERGEELADDGREWQARATVTVLDLNGIPPILFLPQLKGLFSIQDIGVLLKALKNVPCAIKTPTPAGAQHLAAMFASKGVKLAERGVAGRFQA